MITRIAISSSLLLTACGASNGFTFDAAVDNRDAAPVTCSDPDDCAWIDPMLHDVVAILSGAQPVSPGVTLVRRSSVAERANAREYLTALLTSVGLTVTARNYGTGTNLVVHLPPTTGPDTGPMLVVGGHFDGVAASPAAADNATGTAVAVVAARYLASRPRVRPIEIVLFDQEEAGLIGSGAYVAALAGAPIHAAHDFDMISFDGDHDRAVELWSPAPALTALYQSHATARGIPIEPVSFAFSDHQSFVDRGLPAVGVAEEFVSGDVTAHYHMASDTLDKINFVYLGDVTRLALEVLEADAN